MTRATAEMRPPAATAFAYSLALLLALAGLTAPPARGADPAAIRWQTATLEGHHGKTAEAQLGRLTVPMRRDAPDAGSVELALLRLPSRAATPGPPIVFLAGGPGGSGIGAGRIPGYFETFVALTELADVILLDQRGTGASTPRLFCPATSLPSPRLFADWAAARRFLVDGAVACRDTLAAQGVDLAGFHSVESADDLDDLRRALGAEKISLLGFSYGTHLAAAAMRRHGERLHRVVLVGVEGPDHTRKLPSSLDTQMRRLSLLAAGDPRVGTAFPDTYGTLKRLLSRLEEQPVTVSIPDPQGRPVEVPVGREGLQLILTMDAGDGNDFPVFPALVYGLDQGDAGILAWFVRKRIAGFSRGVLATFYAVDGASGASPERWLRIEREARDAILGNVANAVFPEVNAALGIPDLGEGLRAPLHSTVPTLLISGELDSNAPPYQAEELRWGLTDGTHLVVAHAGHEGMLGREDVGIVIRDFLRGDDVRDRHLALPPVRFLSLAEAKEQRALRR